MAFKASFCVKNRKLINVLEIMRSTLSTYVGAHYVNDVNYLLYCAVLLIGLKQVSLEEIDVYLRDITLNE